MSFLLLTVLLESDLYWNIIAIEIFLIVWHSFLYGFSCFFAFNFVIEGNWTWDFVVGGDYCNVLKYLLQKWAFSSFLLRWSKVGCRFTITLLTIRINRRRFLSNTLRICPDIEKAMSYIQANDNDRFWNLLLNEHDILWKWREYSLAGETRDMTPTASPLERT